MSQSCGTENIRRSFLTLFKTLRRLKLGLRPEKTFMGRKGKGFDLLGYHITPQGLTTNPRALEKALKIAQRRYAQGGPASLQEYFKRWGIWVHAGLPFVEIHHADTIIESLTHALMQGLDLLKPERAYKPCPVPLSAVNGHNTQRIGRLSCEQNFSRHQ